jgi:hypothetical protein
MGKDNGIDTLYLFPQHLLTEIRPCINNKILYQPGRIFSGDFDKNGSAKAFITVVKRLAHFTSAADNWHTLGSTGAQKSYLQAAADCWNNSS